MGFKVSRPKITLKMEIIGFVTRGCERNAKSQSGLTLRFACMRVKIGTGARAVMGRNGQ